MYGKSCRAAGIVSATNVTDSGRYPLCKSHDDESVPNRRGYMYIPRYTQVMCQAGVALHVLLCAGAAMCLGEDVPSLDMHPTLQLDLAMYIMQLDPG